MSELQAIWPEDATLAPTGPSATPPSPADDASRLERIVAEMGGVEAALRRLDDGSYGRCEACGTPLDTAALTADPLTTRCPQHTG